GTYPVGLPLAQGYKPFYVCPRTGLLRAIKRRRTPTAKTPVERIPVDEGHEYRLMKGIWYEVTLAPIAPAAWGQRDVVLGTEVGAHSAALATQTYGANVFAVKRRQLNKREIRQLRREARALR